MVERHYAHESPTVCTLPELRVLDRSGRPAPVFTKSSPAVYVARGSRNLYPVTARVPLIVTKSIDIPHEPFTSDVPGGRRMVISVSSGALWSGQAWRSTTMSMTRSLPFPYDPRPVPSAKQAHHSLGGGTCRRIAFC